MKDVRGPLPWLLFACALLACTQRGGVAGNKQADKQADKASQDNSAANEETCERYGAEVCTIAGPESPTCDALQQTATMLPPAACAVALSDLDYTREKLKGAKKQCDFLVDKLCRDIGPKTETCELVRAETAKFPPERCEVMLQQYDEVLADLVKIEAQNQPLSAEQQRAIAANDAPSFGPVDATVTLVEFSDFECPYCMTAAKTVAQLRDKYGDRVRFVFRQFPLSFHRHAHRAAQAALAAHAQDKFFPYHDRLFALNGALDRDALEREAAALGLDAKRFKAALDDAEYADQVDADIALGEAVSVDGTPTLFLNGKRVDPTDFAALSTEIEQALGEG